MPRLQGRIDIPLNDIDLEHAQQAGKFLKNENIGKISYSKINRAKYLVLDISWGEEGRKAKKDFGKEAYGVYFKACEKIMIPKRKSFYSVMDRLKNFLKYFVNLMKKFALLFIMEQ